MEKLETSFSGKDNEYNPKEEVLFKKKKKNNPKGEEVFRCILTLHSLLENPPGDFPDNFREDIVNGFVEIFSFIR